MIHALQTALVLVFPLLVIFAAVRDAVSYTIPNWISLALIVGFFVAAFAVGVPLPQIGWSALIGVGALAVGIALWAFKWIGGGDAKLFGAAAIWMGWPAAVDFVLVTTLAGGALAIVLLSLRSPLLRPLVVSGPRWFARLAEPGEPVPYGLAIAAGGLAAFADSGVMKALGGL
jgi:prepilin peptidase CpaA